MILGLIRCSRGTHALLMSFTFEWPRFSNEFHSEAKSLLDAALNKGNKPPIIADRIQVVELEMGTQPPELEVRDIGELTTEQFRGIFRLTYSGDAHIVLRTKVQANPLNHKPHDIHTVTGSLGILAAHQPLVVPMLLRLSHFRLSAYVVLVFSRQKGITLVFKTDPLQNVDVNSTFDSIAVIQSYIQKEIEGQLRNMFREDLPSIIHRLSQRWLAAQTKIPVKIDTSYPVNPIPVTKEALEALGSLRDVGLAIPSPSSLTGTNRRRRNSSLYSRASKVARSAVDLEPSAFPDIEHFDPTYGLRPEGVPTKASYNGYASLFVPDRGLSALTEDLLSSDSEDELDLGAEAASFDGGESHLLSAHPSERQEYESIPAVGGGTITRPRIYHAQSFASQQSPRPNPINSPSIGSVPIRVARTTTHDHRPQKFADEALPTPTPHTVQAEPLAGPPEPTGNLVFRPALNSNVSHLSMLSNSYHTLSPYTRSMDHYIMRSGPPKDPNATVVERQPLKARRRRTYKIRSSSVTQEEEPPQHQTMPVTPRVDPVPLSDYDRAEIEHYFRMSEN